MKEVLDFMRELSANNNKAWFDANRERYTRVRKRFNGFVEELIDGISTFDPSVKGLRVQDCTYRINRDIRFSPDKSPYKGWLGAFIAPHGKCSGYGGYYFHIEPEGDTKWHNQLVSGVYMPEDPVLRSLREEILDNGAEIAQALREAEGFTLYEGNKLKRTPKGFPADTEYDEWLKLKEFWITKPIDERFLTDRSLLRNTVEEFRKTKHLLEILNRAVQFAYEEMM